jgi:hypothetical protein
MDNLLKIKTDFEEVAKGIAEKEKMYIENAKKSGTTKDKPKGRGGDM